MAGSPVTLPRNLRLQAQSVPIHNENDDVFSYKLVQLRYLEACEDYFSMPNSITGPWTQQARNHIICSIKANSKVLSLMDSVYNLEHNVLEQYQIVLEDGEEKLVLTGTSIEALPYEESFDIFVELHRKTGHGGFEVIQKRLEKIFLVNDVCLNFFLINCNTCKKFEMQKVKPAVFNDCVSIDILKAPIKDVQCRFILFYIDKVTNFMLFKPLIAVDEYEISIEMLKIFTNFGPPLVIQTVYASLINRVLILLRRGGLNYNITVHEGDKLIGESLYLMQKIIERTNPNSSFWSTTCRFVQYKHNKGQIPMQDPLLDKVVNIKAKPYNKLFNMKRSVKTVRDKQTLTKKEENDTIKIMDTSSDVGTTIEEYVNLETSDTETAKAEEGECPRAKDTLHLNQNVLNVVTVASDESDEETLYNTTLDNDYMSDNEIKIEYNPIQASSNIGHLSNETSEETFTMPEIKVVNTLTNKTNTPVILNSTPLKQDPMLEESLRSSGSGNTTEVFPISDTSLDTNSKISLKDDNNNDFCSGCNGKMLTDFFCFECKKKTHIFCMARVIFPLENAADVVTSFTYCKLCFDVKFNLTHSLEIGS